jgi:hypothetical protein
MTAEQLRACEELLRQFGWTPDQSQPERWRHERYPGWGFTAKNALLKVIEAMP